MIVLVVRLIGLADSSPNVASPNQTASGSTASTGTEAEQSFPESLGQSDSDSRSNSPPPATQLPDAASAIQTGANSEAPQLPPFSGLPDSDALSQYDGLQKLVAALTVYIETPTGTGSGFFLNREFDPQAPIPDFVIVTNKHVVDDHEMVRICWPVIQRCVTGNVSAEFDSADVAIIEHGFSDGEMFGGMAWLAVQPGAIDLGFGGSWQVGDVVLAAGYPGGNRAIGLGSRVVSDPVVTEGIVASRNLARYRDGYYIEHGADVAPGSSGGPLMNSSGHIIGINSGSNTQAERLEAAVPVGVVLAWLQDDQSIESAASTIPPAETPDGATETAPVATPTDQIPIGSTVRFEGSSYIVHEVRDPVPPGYSGVDEGNRFVAVDVTQISVEDGVRFSYLDFSVQDADGYVYSHDRGADMNPDFGYGSLASGQRVRGWVSFQIPEDATLVRVLAEGAGFGAQMTTIADLTVAALEESDGATETAPVATPTDQIPIGSTVRFEGSSYIVHEVRDPVPPGYSGVDEGNRFVAVDVTQISVEDGVRFSYLDFSVQDADGYVYSHDRGADINPDFGYGSLASGQRVRGWVSFQIPEDATLVRVLAEGAGFGAQMTTIADLTVAALEESDGATETAPVATPTDQIPIGSTVRFEGSSYIVHEVRDPVPPGYSGVDEGNRFVAVDVTQISVEDGVRFSYLDFSVQDADGYVYSHDRGADINPDFGYGSLASGQRVRGWVSFQIPEDATLVRVLAEGAGFGAQMTTIADLTVAALEESKL